MKNRFRLAFLCGATALFAGFFTAVPSAQATGIPVVDVLANGNILHQTIMQVTEFTEQIGNQVRQISQAATQITQFYTMIEQGVQMAKVVGDPSKLMQMIGITQFTQSFQQIAQMHATPPMNTMFSSMTPSMISSQSLMGNGSQMFSSGQAILPTMALTNAISGVTTTIQRDLNLYKGFATMESLMANLTKVRATDRQVQQQMNTQVQSLTKTLASATDQATVSRAIAGIQTAHATAAASSAEVAKAQADYNTAAQHRTMETQKQAVANQEMFDAEMNQAKQDAAIANTTLIGQVSQNVKTQAQTAQSQSFGMTPAGYEKIPILATSKDGSLPADPPSQ